MRIRIGNSTQFYSFVLSENHIVPTQYISSFILFLEPQTTIIDLKNKIKVGLFDLWSRLLGPTNTCSQEYPVLDWEKTDYAHVFYFDCIIESKKKLNKNNALKKLNFFVRAKKCVKNEKG
jgi:hypothetical protein